MTKYLIPEHIDGYEFSRDLFWNHFHQSIFHTHREDPDCYVVYPYTNFLLPVSFNINDSPMRAFFLDDTPSGFNGYTELKFIHQNVTQQTLDAMVRK